ncbi:recombination protein NinG [Acidovorax sp. FG27]|uniref:recombination protein NinG n=1 Tax=Acidovorax sp. FG27 TaxID=3133652 RepID=UPI0030E84CD3
MTFRRTRCPHCRGKLEAGQRIHPACIDGYAEAQAAKAERAEAKKARAAAKVERAETRRRKEAIKTVPALIREAQQAFNAWVRARDAAQPCISCGAPPPDLSGLHAGRDAGHYRSTGSASHLRFHPDNCHAQCVHCNQWGAGKAVDYRIRLLVRIGLARVEALESDNRTHKWAHDELRGIRDHYRAALRLLVKSSCSA